MRRAPEIPPPAFSGLYADVAHAIARRLGALDRTGARWSLLDQLRRARWQIEARHPDMTVETVERLTVRQVLALLEAEAHGAA